MHLLELSDMDEDDFLDNLIQKRAAELRKQAEESNYEYEYFDSIYDAEQEIMNRFPSYYEDM